MRPNSRRMAISGMMTALAVTVMLLVGVIPAATFCAPALAGLLLVPVFCEGGMKLALGAYAAVSALSLMLCPDNEAVLLFAFLGWYPAVKWALDAGLKPWPRRLVKLLMWNAAAGAMLAMVAYVLRLDAIMAEYREMGRVSLVGFALLANLTLALYDRLLGSVAVLYVKKLRPKWMKGT